MHAPKCHFGVLVVIAVCGATEGWAQAVDHRLGDLSLEELSNIEITSVSKRAERLSFAPSSVFVITGAASLGRRKQPLPGSTERTVVPTFSDRQDTLDLQLQHSLGSFGSHTPAWGAQYRRGWDRTGNSIYVAVLPEHLNQTWASLFSKKRQDTTPAMEKSQT